MLKYFIIGLVLFTTSAYGLFSKSDDVVELNANNFKSKVLDSNELWLVEFYAPWCGHCKNLAPEWKKAATALKGIVNIGAIDMDQSDAQSVGAPYGIRGFPTIKIFGKNKNKPTDYSGGRTASAIVDDAINQLKSLAKERLTGKSSGSSGGSGGSGSSSDVVELTESNFEKLVLNSDDMWLVEFFAPWCGHCKTLEPEWKKAAGELKGKVKLGAVDATVHASLAQKYGVNGYPTIKYFNAGSKSAPADYDGGRSSSDIVTWATNKFAENAPAPELVELLDQSNLEEACDNKQLCVVAFLPKLGDCQAKCRNKYLDTLRKLGDKFKSHQWSWLWTEASQHKELEKSLSVGGFGFPALAAVNSRKGKFVLMRGSFGENGIREFLRDLSMGRGNTEAIPGAKLPTLQKIAAWDGKDAKIFVEEEIDLSDVDLDDDEDSGFMMRRKPVNEDL